MSNKTKPASTPAPNPAKGVNPPSLPTKATRGDAKSMPVSSTQGNKK